MSAAVSRWTDQVNAEVFAQGSPVPPALVLAVIEAESTGNPAAYRSEVAINDASIGLMQLLLGTARSLGYVGVAGDRTQLTGLFAPAVNIHYGVKFLTEIWRQLGNAAGVASAYNGGIRPNLGFGRPLTGSKPIRVCLAKDGAGQCIQWQPVNPGEYGNPQYVQRVLTAMQRYGYAQPLPPVIITADPDPVYQPQDPSEQPLGDPPGADQGGAATDPPTDDGSGTGGDLGLQAGGAVIALAILGTAAVEFFRRR